MGDLTVNQAGEYGKGVECFKYLCGRGGVVVFEGARVLMGVDVLEAGGVRGRNRVDWDVARLGFDFGPVRLSCVAGGVGCGLAG